MSIPRNVILVTIDVTNLYPSIPQTECLQIIYEEMFKKRHLILADPNLVIQLLQTNMNYNYFSFASLYFQQIHGTAMGAAFSPTIANIFMSVTLNKFLRTQSTKPILLARYVDDILLLWPEKETIDAFLSDLNSFHPNLTFTHSLSESTIDFLDLTIYKGPHFLNTQKLDIKTFQKPQNLYQYLEYTSIHPKSVFRSIIIGECKRYLRSNTRPETFAAVITMFKKRLRERQYPIQLTEKIISRIKFSSRQSLLNKSSVSNYHRRKPTFKCLPLPKLHHLKKIVLKDYRCISNMVATPRFVTLAYPSLQKILVRAEIQPTAEQLLDILLRLQDLPYNSSHVTPGKLPQLKNRQILTKRCRMRKCSTCTHLNCSRYFTSTVTKRSYPLRFSATCYSNYVIYLITCTKCKKQYVGMTTTHLRNRINQHRSNILRNKPIYISRHFNFPNHSIDNLSVQIIDRVTNGSLEELQQLERFWIHTLHTLQPRGLNIIP